MDEMRLIDANDLRKKAVVDIDSGEPFIGVQELDEAPTVDAAPVVHGRWIDKTVWVGGLGHIRTQCSVCGTVYPNKPGSRGDGKGGKFCEECGAKMDLKED